MPRGEQVKEVEGIDPGLMADAQRFIVLGQTDSLWKEHLQARGSASVTVYPGSACMVCKPAVQAARGCCA